MIEQHSLMRLHVAALFTQTAAGRLVAVNDPGAASAPRFFLGRTDGAAFCWFHEDVAAELTGDLQVMCDRLPCGFEQEFDVAAATPFIERLSRDVAIRSTWAGPVFRFPAEKSDQTDTVRVTAGNADVLTTRLADWRGNVATGAPMYATLENGKAVSVCCSVRVTPAAHDAGVETHPEFRGRGHAARATLAWARAVREMNAVPLYSTSWQNTSSRALARRMGLIQFGSDLHVT